MPRHNSNYFKYLRNPNLSVPRSTKHNRERNNPNSLPAISAHQPLVLNKQLRNNDDYILNFDNAESSADNEQNSTNNHGFEGDDEQRFNANLLLENETLNELEADEIEQNLFHNDIEDEEGNEYNEESENEIHIDLQEDQTNLLANVVHEDEENEERIPIYPGANLTQQESDLLIMSFLIRHNLTDYGLEDLLELINCHLPISLNTSKYKFLKRFPSITSIKSFYYCPDCFVLLVFENGRNIATCASCHQILLLNSLKRNGHFFLHISLKEQLINLLSGPLFYFLQRTPHDSLSDVISGSVYRKLRENGTISNYDITLQWNADGVQTFKSSKVSMCPLQVSINELNYRQRKENILLAGIWASVKKPVLDLFLKPFIDELKDLHQNGFECLPPGFNEPITIKVHTILSSVDSVERCALQNIHQYNGTYGCSFCLNPGEHILVGNGYARVYSGGKGLKRTEHQHKEDAIKAEREETVVNGVKGVSILMLLPVFNIIKSFPLEYMHSVLLGVVKLFLAAWIDPKNYRAFWYMGSKVREIDARLFAIFPPCEISQTPQSVTNICQWKASEYKNFLLYYSLPILKDLLPRAFYKHWSLLVYAINIFNSEKISAQAFEKATRSINKFVTDIERLYGKEFLKFNVHLLLHLPKSVNDFGALWAWSAFPYESNNYILRKMLHNSQTVLQQVCKSYLRFQSVKHFDVFSKPNCSTDGKSLYLKMMANYRRRTGTKVVSDNRLIIFGTGTVKKLNLIQKLSIQALIQENINDFAVAYDRFIYNNILFHSNTYEKMMKRNNSIIKTTLGTFVEIIGIFCVSISKKYVILAKSFEALHETLCTNGDISSASYLHPVRETNNIVALLPQNISKKCIFLLCNGNSYIMELINNVETD
ncbi:uncharacterized protein LOC118647308 [Monomorium pharaonis]|uniref:uncharacterized protein LOC118647308 n=1 Tax=Monomorium pharaonis TaxID=307658 RepID=UPI001746DEFD|nr:uncharacterized protein LOC118647308 [Monomorium pharaonis]